MVSKKLMDCQAERDCHALRLEQIAPQDVEENRETRLANQGILQKHLHHIADLEAEVTRLKKVRTAVAVLGRLEFWDASRFVP